MPSSQVNRRYYQHDTTRFCQGDILRDLKLIQWVNEEGENLDVISRFLPYAIVLSQECDLEQDFKTRKDKQKIFQDQYLQSILLCPAYVAERFREGTHMEELGLKMERKNSERYKIIKNNNNYRYHFLPEFIDYQVPDLALDFKQYFTIPRDVLYKQFKPSYTASISELFRENLSQRFSYYLGRIGEPEIKTSNI